MPHFINFKIYIYLEFYTFETRIHLSQWVALYILMESIFSFLVYIK